jgi:hypothetical protein
MDEALTELFLQPIHHPFKEFMNSGQLHWLVDHCADRDGDQSIKNLVPVLDEVERKLNALLFEVGRFIHGKSEPEPMAGDLRRQMEVILSFQIIESRLGDTLPVKKKAALKYLKSEFKRPAEKSFEFILCCLFGWVASHALGSMSADDSEIALQSRVWMDEWLLNKLIAGALVDYGMSEKEAWQAVGICNLLVLHQDWFEPWKDSKSLNYDDRYAILHHWLEDNEIQRFLQINRHKGILWFNKEAFEYFLWWMYLISVIQIISEKGISQEKIDQRLVDCYTLIDIFRKTEDKSGYQVEKILEIIKTKK